MSSRLYQYISYLLANAFTDAMRAADASAAHGTKVTLRVTAGAALEAVFAAVCNGGVEQLARLVADAEVPAWFHDEGLGPPKAARTAAGRAAVAAAARRGPPQDHGRVAPPRRRPLGAGGSAPLGAGGSAPGGSPGGASAPGQAGSGLRGIGHAGCGAGRGGAGRSRGRAILAGGVPTPHLSRIPRGYVFFNI
jgi:hypothetical protein